MFEFFSITTMILNSFNLHEKPCLLWTTYYLKIKDKNSDISVGESSFTLI